MKKNIKFKWETDNQFEYRQKIEKISNKISLALGKMQKALKDLNYENILKEIEEEYNILKNMKKGIDVPLLYVEQHSIIFNGVEYYVKAFKLLVASTKEINFEKINEAKKQTALINKASTFIMTGNAFMTIATTKSLEVFEIMEVKYKEEINQRRDN